MRMPTSLPAASLLLPLGAATMIIAAAPARAGTVEFPQVQSMYHDAALCGGNIRSWADTDPKWPGRAIINVQALPVGGFDPGEYSFAPMCETVATVAWRNTNTGAAGELRVPILAGFYGSEHYAVFQDTGPGHIVVNVFTDMPNIPAQSAFDVPG
ncbi:hypothetical protein [Nocardia sp. CDC160]|uniref:hypothetical protein n=1 Tax=Nocardia sp. CDC160 TaxID=3112166 RepID=UPI002DB9928A|nr:hypothetical protein [Nocardia sp. CDC160]MEC3916848.1 hypothetical protein [Nocardia sp. CDC160]